MNQFPGRRFTSNFVKLFLMFGIMLVPQMGFTMGRSLLDKMALYPSTDAMESGSATRNLLSSGIEVWIHRRPAKNLIDSGHKVYLVHFVGNASRAEVEGPEFNLLNLFPAEYDVESWAVNYRGYGGSTGIATLASLPETGLRAFDEISLEAGKSPIFISGFSMGTSVALYLANHRKAAGLILRNPVPLKEMILGKYGWWNLWLAAGPLSLGVPWELDSVKNAAGAQLPALFLSSELDSLIPRKYQNKIINKYAGPMEKVVLENCDHGDELPQSSFEPIRNALAKMLSKFEI